MKGTRVVLVVFLALVVMAAPAAVPVGAAPNKESAQAAKARGTEHYREWLTKQIRHELVMLPYYSVFDNLAFKIEGDKVILLGQVSRPSLKGDAANVVKKLEGVAAVDNQIEVLPVSPMDDRLRIQLYRAIYSDPMLDHYALQAVPPIHIIVKNGRVTLEGVVSSEAHKNVAGIRANGVSGIFAVSNNLRIEK